MQNAQRMWKRGLTAVRYGTLGITSGLLIAGMSAVADPVRYVAGKGVGDDSNSGETESAPVRTLQVAIDSLLAVGGTGRIIVGRGVYAPITVPNAPIIIEARDGPDVTFIDGGETNRCATLGVEDEGLLDGGATIPPVSTVLSGFTLMNGKADGTTPANARLGGGAVFFGRLTNCVIAGNSAVFGGGASFSSLSDCVIMSNMSSGDGGGAAVCALTDCVVSNNMAAENGGGVAHGILNACKVIGNKAGNDGGGVAGGFIMANSTVSGNRAWRDGGGVSGKAIALWEPVTRSLLESCEISGNTAVSGGGGVVEVMAINCMVSGNTASYGGGMMTASAMQCLITGNHATASGGGGASDSIMVSSTVVGNTVAESAEEGAVAGVSRTMSNSSIVWGNTRGTLPSNYGPGATFDNTFTVPAIGGNNVSADTPGFRGEDDYRLTADSPCLDVGDTAFIPRLVKTFNDSFDKLTSNDLLMPVIARVGDMGGFLAAVRDRLDISKDFAGNPRFYNAALDIGAYEFNSATADRIRLDGLDDMPETEDDLTVIAGDGTQPATNAFGYVTVPVGGSVVGGTNDAVIAIAGADSPLSIPGGSLITPKGLVIIGDHTVNPDGTVTVGAGGAVYAYILGARPVVILVPDGGVSVNPATPSVAILPGGPVIGIPADVPGSEADLAVPVITGIALDADGTLTVIVSNCVALTGVYTLWGTPSLDEKFKKLPIAETIGYTLPNGVWTLSGIPMKGENTFFLKVAAGLQKATP